MKKSTIFIIFIIFIINLSFIFSICTVELSDNTPVKNQFITAIMSCNKLNEKNQLYTLTWYDKLGNTIQINSGVTPSTKKTPFFKSLTVPNTINGGSANLTGINLEGEDNFTVVNTPKTLLISNPIITNPMFLGKSAGLSAEVKDLNNNLITGAKCIACAKENTGAVIGVCSDESISVDGKIDLNYLPSITEFNEDRQYLIETKCFYTSSINETYDYNGVSFFPFNISKWLNVETLIDKTVYYNNNEISICSNVTNIEYDKRIKLKIYYQLRCSSDNNNDNTDRFLLISDDSIPDIRGISINTTQNQCKRFILDIPKNLQGKNSFCYASTETEVIDEKGKTLMTYNTASSNITLISDYLLLRTDFIINNDNKISTKINLSSLEYNEYNSNISSGKIRVILDTYKKSIKHEDKYYYEKFNFNDILNSLKLKNIDIKYCNGTDINNKNLIYSNNGELLIVLNDVDLTRNGCYDIIMNIDNEVNKMFNVNISLIVELLFFLLIGIVVVIITRTREIKSENISFWISFICFGMSIIEIPLLLGLNYLNYTGIDVTNIIKINFLSVSFVLFAVGLISLLFVQLNVFNMEKLGSSKKRNKEQW